MRALHSLLLSLLALSCADGQVIATDLADLDIDFAVPVVVDKNGVPNAVFPPFRIVEGQIEGDTPVLIPATLSDESVILVGLDPEQSPCLFRGFEPARQSELRLTIESPPVDPELRTDGVEVYLAHALDAVPFYLVNEEEGNLNETSGERGTERARDALTARVPVNAEATGLLTRFEPFAQEAELLPNHRLPESSNLVDIVRLDRGRAVALAHNTVWLFERDTTPNVPAGYGPLASVSIPAPIAYALAVSRQPQGRYLGFVVGMRCGSITSGCQDGLVWSFEVSDTGLTQPVVAHTVPGKSLYDVTVDAGRRIVAVGAEGIVLSAPPDSRNFTEGAIATSVVSGRPTALEAIVATKDAARPHLATGTGRVYLGDLTANDVQVEPVANETVFIAAASSGDTLWVGSNREVYRSDGGPFEPLALQIPAAFNTCSVGDGATLSALRSLAADEEALHLITGCRAILSVSRAGCVAGAELIGATEPPLAIDVQQDMVTVAGPVGALFNRK